MNNRINIAVLPLPIAWCDYDSNMAMVHDSLRHLQPGTDILVLPELFSTGFIQDESLIEQMATNHGQEAIDTVRQWSADFNVAIVGSVLIKEDGKYLNRGFFVEPSGEITLTTSAISFASVPRLRSLLPEPLSRRW